MPPVAARLRAVFPPYCHALHPRHKYYLRCLSTRLDLAYFWGRARTSVFGPCAMGEPLVFGPNARPNSHAARRRAPPCRFASVPPCPSLKTYIHLSFVVFPFHTLGLSLFSGSCPNLPFRPLHHGRTPRFRPKRKAEQPCRPSSRASVSFCLRSTVPFTQDIHTP